MPIFSIVIPTYNRASLIQKCLESLVLQSETDFEVIVCDNGSTDNTSEIVKSFNEKLKIKYFLLEPSGGPARPRNVGIQNADGEWICLLDSDDWWTKDKLSEIRKQIDDYDFIYHSLIRTDGQSELGLIGEKMKFDDWEGFLVYGNPIPNSAVSFRKSFIRQIGLIDEDARLKTVEDCDFWMRFKKAKARFGFIDRKLGYFYWNPGNTLSEYSEMNIKRHEALLAKHATDFKNSKLLKAASANLDFRRVYIYLKMRGWKSFSNLHIGSVCYLSGWKRKFKYLAGLIVGKLMAFFT